MDKKILIFGATGAVGSSLAKLISRDELHDNINGLVLDARSLLDDVKKNPAKYLRAWFEAKKK